MKRLVRRTAREEAAGRGTESAKALRQQKDQCIGARGNSVKWVKIASSVQGVDVQDKEVRVYFNSHGKPLMNFKQKRGTK